MDTRKTRFSFDEKLHPVGEFALGKPINKGEYLWEQYKKARKLRNDVSHTAKRMNKAQATSVIQTVDEWLRFLESTEEFGSKFERSDVVKDFFQWHAILESRFVRSEGMKPQTLSQLIKDALARGAIEPDTADKILKVGSVRNRLAHGRDIDERAIARAITVMKDVLSKSKGNEFG